MSDKPILVCTSVNDIKAARDIANTLLTKNIRHVSILFQIMNLYMYGITILKLQTNIYYS